MAASSQNGVEKLLKGRITDIKDYPKKGIVFRDITSLIDDAQAFGAAIDRMAQLASTSKIDYIVGIEARGFVLGSALAYRMKKGFILIRKKGKLPRATISKQYDLEYGSDTLEMHRDAIKGNGSVLIVDDLLATGGTAKAVAELVEEAGGKVAALEFLVELTELNGREKLSKYDVISVVRY